MIDTYYYYYWGLPVSPALAYRPGSRQRGLAREGTVTFEALPAAERSNGGGGRGSNSRTGRVMGLSGC